MRLRRNAAAATLLPLCLILLAGGAIEAIPNRPSARGGSPAPRPDPEVDVRVIEDPQDLLTGPGADGRVGDVLLRNGAASFIISAVDHAPEGAASGGHLIDAVHTSAPTDLIEHMLMTLGDWPRQAVYDSLTIADHGDEVVAAVLGRDADVPGLSVTTRYVLAAGEPALLCESVLMNTTGGTVDVELGDSIAWGEAEHFVPGYGFDVTGLTTLYDEWVGAHGVASYAYCTETTSLSCTHGIDWTDARTAQASVAPGESLVQRRYLCVGGALSEAGDAVHAIRGTPTGTVRGGLTAQDSGLPLTGVALDCEVNGLAPYTRIVTGADGRFTATLPPASYEIPVSTDGYYSDELEISVAAGGTTNVDVALRPVGWNADKGDTLTTIMRPILSVPTITTPGGSITIEALAPSSTGDWRAAIALGPSVEDLPVETAAYDPVRELWAIEAGVPAGATLGLHDLVLTGSGGIADTAANAVGVRPSIDDTFYVVHITDTHLPTHNFSHDGESALEDSSEMTDLRAVIEDINTINPAFVIHTGDLVNEGELEDYLGARVYTRAKRLLSTLEVPVYVVGGNHDLGGWSSTPPSDGTARRDWWRFFGWRYLADPPPGHPVRTQDYSFDYGGVHFVGLEAYDNYDHWRQEIYGNESFTDGQLEWLFDDLALAGPATPTVLFYHYDFSDQIDLTALGVECALWGHIHWSSGSITEPPYNISTGTVCDGRRLFRLIRFSGGEVIPSHTISAGTLGLLIRTSYDVPNDGTNATVTATVTNETSERFEHAVVRFRVPTDDAPYTVDSGTLLQTVIDGDEAECLVTLEVPSHSEATVTIFPDTTAADIPDGTVLHQSAPNPARSGTTFSFALASRARVSLEIYDVTGRLVATPYSGVAEAGPHEQRWNLTDRDGRPVASGIYFYRLTGSGIEEAKKLVIVRQ